MKKILFAAILLNICALVSFAQAGKKTSLLISNCKAGEGTCRTQQLFRYDFVDGVFAGKEEIVSAEGLSFDSWGDRIYQNRYVVTRWGTVIDTAEKKILHTGKGELHRIDNDKIFIRRNNVDDTGLYVFDLQSKTYELVRKFGRDMWSGKLSPSGLRTASYRCPLKGECGFEISEINKGSKMLEVRTNVVRTADTSSSQLTEPPIYWLDDERFITQRNNGELIVVSVKGKVTPLLNIKIDQLPDRNPQIYLNRQNELVYNCVNYYVIDVEKRTYREMNNSVGNGFSVGANPAVKSYFGTGNIYYFNETEIGRIWAVGAVTTNDYLAVIYGKDGSNLGYPDGVKVWSNIKKAWTTLEINGGAEIIGWLNY